MTSRDFRNRLTDRLQRSSVTVDESLFAPLERYFRLLATWNQRTNLTSFQLDELSPEALDRLFVEPLAAARHVPAGVSTMIDLGSGGGSPAIPLALTIPAVRLRLVESKTRKSVFLRQAMRTVGFECGEVITSRIEDVVEDSALKHSQDLVTVRAVRLEAEDLERATTLMAFGGQMFLFRSITEPDVVPPQRLTSVGVTILVPALSSRLVVLKRTV